MNKAKSSREASDLTALVNEMIAYWKSIAERIFIEVYPFSERDEFDQNWPKTLDNDRSRRKIAPLNDFQRPRQLTSDRNCWQPPKG